MKCFFTIIFFLPFIVFAEKKTPPTKGVLNELKLNKKNETENLKTAAKVETIISKSEEKAIDQLEKLLKKYKGTSQEPDLLFRLAELHARRAKTGRFVDLYRGEKTLAEILTSKLTSVGAKEYLSKAIANYKLIHTKFPKYPALDEVLFNMAFAYEQRGDSDLALKNFLLIVEKYPQSPLLPETHMALGELYFIKQKYQESLHHYEKVQEWPEAPIAPVALYKSSWSSYNLKDTLGATQKLEKLLLQSKERPLISHVRSEAKRDLALFFSEVGDAKNAISYLRKHLLENEIGPTILELSNIYERHAKLIEMDLVLSLFLKEYPEEMNAGTVHLRRVQRFNESLKFQLAIHSLNEITNLCKNEKWKNKVKETTVFCTETYPNQLKDLAAEWWEKWNKSKRTPEMIPHLSFIFQEYIKFENPAKWDVGIHISFADFLFYQKSYKEAAFHYIGVSKIEGLEPSVLPEALYGSIVSLDRELSNQPKNETTRQQLYFSINEYISKCPQGEFINDVFFKKAYLFFEEKEFDQALLWIGKINSSAKEMKEKKEDLILEIHRTKKDYVALETTSAKILKSSTGERYIQIKGVYQSSQQAIIQEFINKNKLEDAIKKSQAFYKEHRPEEKAIDSLHLSIDLFKKIKKFRLAAENSETLAKELKALKKDSEADKASQHAVQLFLQLGDLLRAQESLVLSTELALEESKKKENLELSTEISAWYGKVDTIEKSWKQLEIYLNKEEKRALQDQQFQFYTTYAPEKAKQMKKTYIEKGIEPYFSESQLGVAQKNCEEKKWSQCYQMALKLNKDSTPPFVRAEARYLQSKVLLHEYKIQSLKASAERMSMVMSYKAEKFDKLVQVLNTISQRSEIVGLRKLAVQDLIWVYKDYVTQLQIAMSGFDLANQDLANLKQEIMGILPILENRPQELEVAMKELEHWEENNQKVVAQTSIKTFPQLDGDEMRIYVPTWEEGTLYRPLGEIKGSKQRCSMTEITKMNSLSALGREANFCLTFQRYKELEYLGLKLSDLYPDTPWGPFYLSLMSTQKKSEDRSLWFLKLAQKREKNPLLSYEEIRKNYTQSTDSVSSANLKNLGGTWTLIEEVLYLGILENLKKQKCEPALLALKELRSDHWKQTALNTVTASRCPIAPPEVKRALSSTDSAK